MKKKLTIIIPYYKAIDKIKPLHQRTCQTLNDSEFDWQLIIVDDRSPDQGWRIIQEIAQKDARVIALRLSRNFGQHAAISAGMAYAYSDYYVVMDCDLQDRPEDIPKLAKEIIATGNDIVIAERESHALGKKRFVASELFNRTFAWLSDLEFSSSIGNFRIFNHKAAEAYKKYKEQMRFFPALMSDAGFTVSKLQLPRDERIGDSSSYTISKLINLALEAFVTYSDKPLRITAGIGALLATLSSLLLVVYFIAGLLGTFSVAGFATIVLILLFFGGTQILLISIIGLYVGQVLREAKSRPIFIVDEEINA